MPSNLISGMQTIFLFKYNDEIFSNDSLYVFFDGRSFYGELSDIFQQFAFMLIFELKLGHLFGVQTFQVFAMITL